MKSRYEMWKVPDMLRALTDQYCEARFADLINANNFSVGSPGST